MKTLGQIQTELGYTRFRIRNRETLKDMMVVSVSAWAQGAPRFLEAVHLESREFTRFQIPASDNRFVLVSCLDECEYWKGLDTTSFLYKAKVAYKQAGLINGL